MKEIPLTNSPLMAIIDDEDFDLVSKYKWYLHKHGHCEGYKVRSKSNSKIGASGRTKMHRLVMGFPAKKMVDHKDHKKLNNQKYNLRKSTNTQNQRNRLKQKFYGKRPVSSKFKGVSWCPDRGLWQVGIGVKNKRISLGRFDDEIEAALAYNAAAIKLFGEFAYLNQIPNPSKLGTFV